MTNIWPDFITADQLHKAADLFRKEDPKGTPEGHKQAEEIGQFIQESYFRLRYEDGSVGDEPYMDPQSLGFGIVLGMVATNMMENYQDA